MIRVRLPDGSFLNVATDDPKAAALAAQKYADSQAPKPKTFQPVKDWMNDVGGSIKAVGDAYVDDQKKRSEAMQARAKDPLNPIPYVKDQIDQAGRAGGMALNALGAVTSPVWGAVDALVAAPASRMIDAATPKSDYKPTTVSFDTGGVHVTPRHKMTYEEKKAWDAKQADKLRSGINTAVSLAIPTGPPGIPVKRPVVPNALADNVAAFDAAGVEPSLAAARGGYAAKAANFSAENPVGFRPRAQMRRQMVQAGGKADQIAQGYGDVRGPQAVGEDVQAGVTRFAKDRTSEANPALPAKQSSFAAKSDALYERAFQPIQMAEAKAVEKSGADYEASVSAAKARQEAENASRQASWEAAQKQQDADWTRAVAEDGMRVEELRARGYDARPSMIPRPKPIPKPEPAPMPEVTPQRAPVAPTSTISTLKQLDTRVNAPRLSSLITDSRPRSIMAALEEDGAAVRFNDLRELRTWVRNARGNPELRQGIGSAGLERLEQALTADIYSNAERIAGPDALRQLQRTDQFYRAGQTRIQTALQPFADAKSGEGAYSRILSAAGSTGTADAQKLLSLKRSLAPDEWGDVASNVVAELGKPGKGAADQSGFSVNTFVTNYAKLSPRGREVLFGSIGGGGKSATSLKAELDNLAKVAGMLKAVEKGANVSNSGVSMQGAASVVGVLNPGTAGAAIPGLAGIALTGEAMTNPTFVRWLARAPQAARTVPAWKAHLARLGSLAKANAALVPVYESALRSGPGLTAATAEPAAEQPQP